MEWGSIRLHLKEEVHLINVKPGEMIDVKIIGSKVQVIRSAADEALLKAGR